MRYSFYFRWISLFIRRFIRVYRWYRIYCDRINRRFNYL